MTGQTLGRRNAAPVQGTELDLVSVMLDRHVKERFFCTPVADRPQGPTGFLFRAPNRGDARPEDREGRPPNRRPALPKHRGRIVYHKTWDIEGSPGRPRGDARYPGVTPDGGVVPGSPGYRASPRGSAALKQPSLCCMTNQTL